MKKPKWAKQLRYKRVITYDRVVRSPIAPSCRITECKSRKGHGRVLRYRLRSVVRSRNGVCKETAHVYCAGIHAYKSLQDAMNNTNWGDRILRVYASMWYGGGNIQRASRVYVSSIV